MAGNTLSPACRNHPQSFGRKSQPVGAIQEVKLVQSLRVALLHTLESGVAQLSLYLPGREEQLKRLTCRCHPVCQRQAPRRAQYFRRKTVIETDPTSGGKAAHRRDGRAECIAGQIRHNAQPTEKCGHLRIESGRNQRVGQAAALKIHRNKREPRRNRDRGVGKQSAFPILQSDRTECRGRPLVDAQRAAWPRARQCGSHDPFPWN